MFAELPVRPLMEKLSKAIFTQTDEFGGSIPQSTLIVLEEFAQIKGLEFNHKLVERFFRSRHAFFEVDTRIRGANEYKEMQYFYEVYRIFRAESPPLGLVESYALRWGVLKNAVMSAFEPLNAVELREAVKSRGQYSISFTSVVADLELVFDVYGSLGKSKRIYFTFNILDQSREIVATVPVSNLFGDMRDLMIYSEEDTLDWAGIYADWCNRISKYCQREW